MNEYDLQNALNNLISSTFQLNDLTRLNIVKEMWNILSVEEKKNIVHMIYNNVIKSLENKKFSNIDFNFNELKVFINKEDVIRQAFIENNNVLVDLIKDQVVIKIKELILNIKSDNEVLGLIKPQILKIVKECYQNILSYHGDAILKETKNIIVKVTSEESIINYAQNLIKKAKSIVDQEIIKELIE